MTMQICMIDDDINQMEVVKKYFLKTSGYNFVSTVSPEEFFDKYIDTDILIVDTLISGNNLLSILSTARERNPKQKIIVTSEYSSHDLMKTVNQFKINYFIKKPYKEDEIFKIIEILCKNEVETVAKDNDLKVAITDMLHNLGIPSHIRGYAYIRDGISMMYENENLIGSITKELYPFIANTYKTTSSRVERAIRHAIEVSWTRGDYDLMESLFGNSVDYDRAKPTNSEFIATIADRLKLERNN